MNKDNRNLLNVLSVLIFALLLLGAGNVSPASAEEFSADMVSKSADGNTQAKIYVGDQKIRMEMADSTIIVRNDKKVTWIIMPTEKMYMEQPVDPSKAPKITKNFEGEIERVSLGTETIDGHPAEKFKVTYMDGNKQETAFQWLRDSNILVKVEAEDGSWSTEYKNIAVGPQSADLFEPPEGYQMMTMPSIGSMFQQ